MPIDRGRILYIDDALLAVHKLSGELSVRGKGEVGRLPLFDFLRSEFPGIRPLNRLDFETSGIVLFARRKDVMEMVVESRFKGWAKAYRTIVAGHMQSTSGAIKKALPGRGTRDLLPAETRYRAIERFEDCTYLEATIEHGRHHQIRRHLAHIGHALALDTLYGDRAYNRHFSKRYGFHKFFLHAFSVDFIHPLTGQKTHIESPMPAVFERALERIRRGGERLQ